MIKYFKNKNQALLYLTENNLSKIICNRGITKYFLMDNHNSFINFIKKCNKKDFYEFIPSNTPISFYYDIEIYVDENITLENVSDNYYLNYESIVNECIQKVFDTVSLQFPEVQMKRIILESHSDTKRSFHIILRFIDTTDNKEILFENVQTLKSLYKDFGLNKYLDSQNRHLIDPSVYREGLFRTLYSTKNNENRPFKRSDLSDEFEDVESLVCYTRTLPIPPPKPSFSLGKVQNPSVRQLIKQMKYLKNSFPIINSHFLTKYSLKISTRLYMKPTKIKVIKVKPTEKKSNW